MHNEKQRRTYQEYPGSKNLSKREAMLRAYDFLTGKVDFEEKEKAEIKKMIQKRRLIFMSLKNFSLVEIC